MTKAFIDELISNMRKAGIVARVTPWMVEGIGKKQINVRYIGIKVQGEWLDVFSQKDNLLLKFLSARNYGSLEYYLANATPFLRISKTGLLESDKWETLLGELRRRLKKDKTDYVSHNSKSGNLYEFIKPHLR